ncbi:MAG: CapA family protein [Clostridia bacterium]
MKCHNSCKPRLAILIFTLILSLSFLAACSPAAENPSGTGSYIINTPNGGATPGNGSQELTYTDIRLLSAGDIMYHMPQVNSAYRPASGTYDFTENFQYVKKFISAADYAVVNFETTLANQNKYTSYPTFNSPLSVLDSIKDAGFDMLLFANNHCYDYKKEGFLATLGHFQEYGFDSIGGKTDASAKSYMVKEVKGIKLGLMNYADTLTQPNGQYNTINGITINDGCEEFMDIYVRGKEDALYAEVAARISELKANGAELIILYIHWGDEYQLQPVGSQKAVAQKLCDLGVDVIIGSHPHVIEPMEILTSQSDPSRSTICFYSLGNFISNQNRLSFQDLDHAVRPYTENGLMVTLNIRKYSTGDVFVNAIEYTPTWVHRYPDTDGNYNYNIVPLPQAYQDPASYGLTASDFGVDHATAAFQMTDTVFSASVLAFNTKMADDIAAFSQAFSGNS